MFQTQPPAPAEAPGGTPEQVEDALRWAGRTLYQLTTDQRFLDQCRVSGVIPDRDDATAAYWYTMADTVETIAARHRETGNDCLKLTALQLTAATPALAYAYPTYENPNLTNSDKEDARYRGVAFNGLLYQIAKPVPAQRASLLSKHLLNTVNLAVERPELRAASARDINNRIAGAQYDVGFEQVLRQAGVVYSRTNRATDLHGTDYVVTMHDGGQLHIDIKGSFNRVNPAGRSTREGYFVRSNGVLVLNPLIRHTSFHDTFQLGQDVVVEAAERIVRIIDAVAHGVRIAYSR